MDVSSTLPPVCDFTVFGGTGDLALRKLLPALYHRDLEGHLPADTRIIGVSRSEIDDEGYRTEVRAALERFVDPALLEAAAITRLLGRLHHLCLDADTDTAMYKMGTHMGGQMCSKFKIDVQGGNKVVTDAVCKINAPNGAVNMTSHSETTYTGDTAYATQGHITYDPAIMGHADMAITSSGRWVGQCAAGQKPGDMIMPNGQTMNVKDIPGH